MKSAERISRRFLNLFHPDCPVFIRGAFCQRRREFRIAEIDKAEQLLVGFEAEEFLDLRIARRRSGAPDRAQAFGVSSQQQILDCCRYRTYVLDLQHSWFSGFVHPDRNQDRGAQGFGAFDFQRRIGKPGFCCWSDRAMTFPKASWLFPVITTNLHGRMW